MKRILAVFVLVMMLIPSVSAFAAGEVSVTLNGEPIEFDVPAQIIIGRDNTVLLLEFPKR